MNFQLIHVEQLNPKHHMRLPVPAQPDEYQYVGIAIEERGKHYYWARGVSIEITDWEYANIKLNPKLFYFSTALKLHHRIERVLASGRDSTHE